MLFTLSMRFCWAPRNLRLTDSPVHKSGHDIYDCIEKTLLPDFHDGSDATLEIGRGLLGVKYIKI